VGDERRTRGHIPWSDVDARLRAGRELWMATASPEGRPDAKPVWFWWDGDCVFFTCAPASRKARNIAHEPHVVAHNGDGADPIIVRGRAELVADAAARARVDAGYRAKYVDPHSGTRAALVEGDCLFRVRPRLVSAWSYATVATRTDWRFE